MSNSGKSNTWVEQSIDIANEAIETCYIVAQENNISIKKVLAATTYKISSILYGMLPIKKSHPWIYYIKSDDKIKIGVSINPKARLATISTMCPNGATLLGIHEGTSETEKEIHEKFHKIRCNGEWFFSTKELNEHIGEVCIKWPK